MNLEDKTELTLEEVAYVVDFAKYLQNTGSYLYDPRTANQMMKNLNMQPALTSTESIKKMLENPQQNEASLRKVSQYFYNTQMPFRRLVDYYGGMLEFDYFIYPVNATEKEMSSAKFNKDLDMAYKFFEKFDVKREFSRVMNKVLLEDVDYVYLRDSGTSLTLQEMPSDYCIIDARSEYGYMYSFDLMYFMQMGVDINGFAPIFKTYYTSALEMKTGKKKYAPNIRPETRDGRYMYWQSINPKNGWVFKFDDNHAGCVPPLASLFVSASEIETYRQLQKNKEIVAAYKLIVGTIPRHKDGKAGNQKDDIAISPETAAKFSQLFNSALPDGVGFKAAPFEQMQMFQFEAGEDTSADAIQRLYSNSGTSGYLFATGDKANASTIKATQTTDANFVKHMYYQFATFVNFQLANLPTKYKFKAHFEGTMWDGQERRDNAMKYAMSGMILPQLGSAMGMSPFEFQQVMSMTKATKFVDKMLVLPTAYTAGAEKSTSANGRPTKAEGDLGDSGEVTRDAGSNVDKGAE